MKARTSVSLYSDQTPRLSAADRAYQTLRNQIISLELAPNESIGEQMLAERLGVSRTPVREAFAKHWRARLLMLASSAKIRK